LPGAQVHVETRLDAPPGLEATHPAWPVRARLAAQTDRYSHDVLGGIPRWGRLEVEALPCGTCSASPQMASITLPDTLVFEDTEPRLWDVTGDGRPEIVVVQSDVDRGARLTVWDFPKDGADLKLLAATPFIGTRFRWFSVQGTGDFDGDGRIEITYVDRPHLAQELVFLRYTPGKLTEVARLRGVTNHRIGDAFISGGVRRCAGAAPEAILASGDWKSVIAVRLNGKKPEFTRLGPLTGAQSLTRALRCPN
ncbi:MAG: VCBS repeat-containing protein, partial [Paracoccaceae bacterium]|nr:VCBS repeat-containing protein [Paracoccaceae bacterium]